MGHGPAAVVVRSPVGVDSSPVGAGLRNSRLPRRDSGLAAVVSLGNRGQRHGPAPGMREVGSSEKD